MRMIDRRLASLAGQHKLLFVLAVVLGSGVGAATVVQAYELAGIIDAVFLAGAARDEVAGALALLAAAIVIRAVLTAAERFAAHLLGERAVAEIHSRTLAHLERVGPIHLSGEQSGEIQTALSEGLEDLGTWFTDYLPQLVLSALVPTAVMVMVLTQDPLSALVLGLTAPLIPLFLVLIGSAAESKARERFAALSRMGAFFMDTIQGFPTLMALGRMSERLAVIRSVTGEMRRKTMGVLRLAFLSALALELLATLSTAIVAVEIGLRLLYGRLDFRVAFFVLLLAPEFYLPLRLLGQRFHSGTAGVAAADRIFELLALPASVSVASDHGASMASPEVLELKNVSVTYPGLSGEAPRTALVGVDLRLERGEMVALVGPSGAGKSTVASVLLRLVEPTSGSVTADDVSASDISIEHWRQQLSWAPQHPYILSASVADNIRLARPDATDAEVRKAARRAGAEAFIEGLPRAWDTPVGVRGARLSGGEAQRVALARAFLEDAPVLILDEPATGLDPETADVVERATSELLEGRTALIIAHRLATVRSADRIVVLDGGRVVECGSFDALRAAGGIFSSMVAGLGGVP